MTCHAIRRGDEMKCALCLKTWKHDDPEPPVCPEKGNEKDKNNRSNPPQRKRRFNTIFDRRTFDPERYSHDGPKIY